MKKSIKLIARVLICIILLGDIFGNMPALVYAQEESKEVSQVDTDGSELAVADKVIRLNPMGGQVSEPKKQVVIGEECGTLPTPVREGYVFDGWFTDEIEGHKVTEASIITNEMSELFAKWTPLTIKVNLYADGITLSLKTITATYGRTYVDLPVVQKDGLEFEGWYTDYNGGRKLTKNSIVDYTSEIALYARWKGKEVTVSFDTNGAEKEIEDRTIGHGEVYGLLPSVSREGYEFKGWYLEQEGALVIDEETICVTDKDHTLIAGWSPIGDKISFDTNGGKKISTTKKIHVGEYYGDLPTPQKEGHTFIGWYDSKAEDAERITSDSIVQSNYPNTLYAHWLTNTYEVSLVCNEVTLDEKAFVVKYGEDYDRLPTLTLENYTFNGWYTKPVGGTRITANTKVEIESNQVLYAQWEGNQYTVYFDANGGEVSDESMVVNYGKTYGTMPKPTRKGYDFVGWFTGYSNEEVVVEEQTVRLDSDQTLYAGWEVKKPIITLDANGGMMVCDSEIVDEYEYEEEYGTEFDLLPIPYRDGYTFVGWYTSTSGGTQINDSTLVTATSSDVLYARWNGNPYTVYLDSCGGSTDVSDVTVVCGEAYGTLPEAKMENYTFLGWFSEVEGGSKITSSTKVSKSEDHTLFARYRGAKIRITYNAMGGTSSVSTKDVYYQELYGSLTKPSRSGYEFLGWYTEPEGGILLQEEDLVTLTEDTTVYAQWLLIGYTVTFNAKGGTADFDSTIVVYGQAYGVLPYATREGYEFLGWYRSTSATTPVSESDIVNYKTNITLYAKWSAHNHIVSFDPRGGTVSTTSKTVTYGNAYSTLPTPKRTGYSFAGWYTKPMYGSKVSSTSIVETDYSHTLYAMWSSEFYRIVFEPRSGTVDIKNIAVPKGTTYSAFPKPVREGYTFIGWYTSTSSSGELVTSVSSADTLYAKWKGNQYTVYLDGCGGTPAMSSAIVTFGSTYGTLPTPTKTGCTFAGWYTDPVAGSKVSTSTTVKTMGTHTLYARWKGVSVKLSYDANGGTDITTTKTVVSGDLYGSLKTPTRTGYDFVGWYTKPTGGELITAESIVERTTAHTVYAHWEVKKPTIVFVGNGGKAVYDGLKSAKLEILYTYGEKYTILPNAVRTGYTFLGWYTGSSSGIQILPDEVCEVTSSDTYYAHWEGNPCVAIFDPNDGTGEVTKVNLIYGDEYGTLPTPVREGYTFAGWYTKKVGGVKITKSTTVEILDSKTLYAHWEHESYKLKLDGNGGTTNIVNSEGKTVAVGSRTLTTYYEGTLAGKRGPFPLFTYSGYDFIGFFSTADGGKAITANREVTSNEDVLAYANWKPKEVSVIFDTNGGDAVGSQKTVTYGMPYGDLPIAERKGYIFDGWTTAKNGSTKVTSEKTVSKKTAHTIYAKWIEEQYDIVLNPNGGSVSTYLLSVSYEGTFGTLPKPTREGYEFLGWFTQKNGGFQVKAGTNVAEVKERTLYAHWTNNGYKVTFDANGGETEIASKYVYSGECYGELPAAYKEGYYFTGWYTQESGGNQISEIDEVKINSDQILYAQWKIKSPTILFYANGGNLSEKFKIVTYQNMYGDLPTPALKYYTFEGWYTTPDGTTRITKDTVVDITNTQILYARWTPISVTVSFDSKGGELQQQNKNVVYEKVYGELPIPKKENYIFEGWYTKENGGKLVTSESEVRSAKAHTLYAQWKSAKRVLTFDANGGNLELNQKEIISGECVGVLPIPTRDGYEFSGWFTKAEYGDEVNETTLMPDEDLTLYAHWKANKYTITFDAMGGGVALNSKQVTYDKAYGELPIPEYEGYQFVDWYLEVEGKNRVDKDSIVKTNKDHVLYAYYVKEEPELNKSMEAFHYGEEGINYASGNLSFSCTDMTMKIPGLIYDITRTYNSKNERPTKMGRGWTFSFEGSCELYNDGAIVYLPDGSAHVYRLVDGKYIGDGSRAAFSLQMDNTAVLTKEDQTKYWFRADGSLWKIEDRNGNSTEVIYNNGQIVKIADPTGRNYEIENNAAGYITKITDPLGNSVSYTYNEQGLLSNVTNLLGGVTTYVYNSDRYLEKIIDPNGNVIQDLAYNADENATENALYDVTRYMDSYGSIKTYEYNSDKMCTTVTGEDGREWVYWYNCDMYITNIKHPDGSMSKTEYYEEDENSHYGEVKSTTDEYGNRTSYVLDEQGNVIKTTYSDGTIRQAMYDEWNNCIVEIDERGFYTYHCYTTDGANRIKTVQKVDGTAVAGINSSEDISSVLSDIHWEDEAYIVEEYTYYSYTEALDRFGCPLAGLVKSITNPEGETVCYTYDCYGNAKSVTDAAGNTYEYTYDKLGNKLTEKTPSGNEFRWEYAANGYVTREYYPDGGVAVSVYDLAGHLTQTVSQELYDESSDNGYHYADRSAGTLYRYNSSGRLESVTDALGNTVSYTYDQYGNVIKEARENGSIVSYEYDNRDRLTGQWYQEREGADKILQKQIEYTALPDGESQVTTYLYQIDTDKITHVIINDNRGRQKEEYIKSDNGKTALKKYSYYPDGKLKEQTENGYTTTYRYDASGNQTAVYTPAVMKNGKVYYVQSGSSYDRVGRAIKDYVVRDFVANTNTKFGLADETVYEYESGLLVRETDPSGLVTSYSYDADGNRIRTQVGSGEVVDGTAKITETQYDFRKNPLRQTTYISGDDLIDGEEVTALVTTYQYDKEGRLVAETDEYGITTTYVYDAVGNNIRMEEPVYSADGSSIGTAVITAEYNALGEKIAITDALGNVTKNTYDNRGNLIKVTDAMGGVTLYQYNYYNQKIAEVSPKNYLAGKALTQMPRTEYTYDNTGKLSKQTDYHEENGELTGVVTKTYLYDANGKLIKVADAYGYGTVYSYHPNGEIASEKTENEQKNGGDTTYYQYNVYGEVSEVQSNTNNITYTYDEKGNLLTVTDSVGMESYTYDEFGRKASHTDAKGNTTYYTYNVFNEISSEKKPGDSGIDELTTLYKYDRYGRIAEISDSLGNRKEYQYDSQDNMVCERVVDANTGEVMQTYYSYDLNANPISKTDTMGTLTTVSYDALNRMIEQKDYVNGVGQEPKTTSYQYDANGNCISTTDYLGNTSSAVYDEWNRLVEEYDALGNLICKTTYDNNHRKITTTDALGNTTEYRYDTNGNIVATVDPTGAMTTNTYDSKNNLSATTDALGNSTTYQYDGRNRLVKAVNPMGDTYTYQYDGADNLILQTDGAGNRVVFTYNARNLKSSRRDIGTAEQPVEDVLAEYYQYTADGLLSTKTDRNGVTTTYGYDGFGRLLYEQAGTERKEYTYDLLGNPLTMSGGQETTARTYDAQSRVTSKSVSGIGTVYYTYDVIAENGEVKEILTTPDGVVTETTYDAVGRIKEVSSNQAETVHYIYNANGSRQATVYADGTREDYNYDGASRVTSLVHTDRYGNILDSYQYGYDAAGNLVTETSNVGTTEYCYDANGRISKVTEPGGRETKYTYDLAGNRATKVESYFGEEPVVTVYTYDSGNRMTLQESSDGTIVEYSYDANGNLTSETRTTAAKPKQIPETVSGGVIYVMSLPSVEAASGSAVDVVSGSVVEVVSGSTAEVVSGSVVDVFYAYDAFNRLAEYRKGDTTAYYRYDAEGYRIGKMVITEESVTDTLYFYEGSRVLLEADISGEVTAHNIYGTNLISRTVQGQGYYYLYNAHGDVVMLIDTLSGAIAGTYRYDAFGNVIAKTGDVDNNITYAGYQYDEESGLYYLNARYYDSTTGRFLTEDSYQGRQTDPLSLNRYTYCHNNPVRYTDPSGHAILSALLGRVLVGGLVGAAIEVIDQKLIQKKESIDWKAVAYEAVVGAVGGAIGGIGQTAVKTAATKTAAKVTAKTVAKAAAKTIALEAAGGFIADVGRQVYVDGKAPEEVDYGQAIKTAAVAGTAGAIGYAGEQVVKKAGSQLATNVTKHVDKAVDSVDNQIVRSVPSNQVSASTVGNHVPVSSTSVNKAASITTNSIDEVVPSRSVGAESAIRRSYQDGVDKAAADNAKARTLAVESGRYSVGDATFMDANDAFVSNISRRADVDANGYFDVIAHGTPNGIQITHNGQHMIVDHRTATRLIQNSDGYNGQAIRLLSCNTGALDNGFAQNLANRLNVEVLAPTNYLWSTPNGNYFVAGMTNSRVPDMSDIGSFRLFLPGGNQ